MFYQSWFLTPVNFGIRTPSTWTQGGVLILNSLGDMIKKDLQAVYHRINSNICRCRSLGECKDKEPPSVADSSLSLAHIPSTWMWDFKWNCWQTLASDLPLEKFCYGRLHRRLLRRYRPQSAVNCSTLWERAAGSPPNTSQVSLQIGERIRFQLFFVVFIFIFLYFSATISIKLLTLRMLKLTWLVLGEDPAARSHRVEQFTALWGL